MTHTPLADMPPALQLEFYLRAALWNLRKATDVAIPMASTGMLSEPLRDARQAVAACIGELP